MSCSIVWPCDVPCPLRQARWGAPPKKSSRKIDFPSRTRRGFHNNLSTLCKITENSFSTRRRRQSPIFTAKDCDECSLHWLCELRGYMGQCNSRTHQTLVPFTYIRVCRSFAIAARRTPRIENKSLQALWSNSRKAIKQAHAMPQSSPRVMWEIKFPSRALKLFIPECRDTHWGLRLENVLMGS